MANALYTKAKQKFLEGHFNMMSDTIKASLVDTGQYTPVLATDDFINDIPGGAIVATQTLSNKSVTDGVFDAQDAVFPNVPASSPRFETIVIWQDTGDPATSGLIALITDATGLPTTPNDGNITVVWDNGANKIFKLT